MKIIKNNHASFLFVESEEEAKIKAEIKPKRLRIPKFLTSSDTSDIEGEQDDTIKPVSNVTEIFKIDVLFTPVIFFTVKLFQLKKKLCKKVAQKENSERIIATYKSKVLMQNCRQLSIDDNIAEENLNVNKNLMKDCTVQLIDCLPNLHRTKGW